MNNRDILELCFRNLLRRRTRTLLAIIGVVVGTCAIIVMVSIGMGLSVSYQEQIESYGNLHMVTVMPSGGGNMYGSASSDNEHGVINDKALEQMEKIEGVSAVTPVISEYLVMGIGKKIASAEVLGVNAEVLEKFNFAVQDGKMLKATDKMGLLFGSQVPYWFYTPGKDDWGGQPVDVITNKIILTGNYNYGYKFQESEDDIKYPEYEVKGVGLLEESNDDSAYSVYMNIKDMEKIQKELRKARKEVTINTGTKTYNQAFVYVGDINYTEKVSKTLKEDMGFQTYSPTDWLEQAKETSNMIQGILGGIGGISLLVAALGITNTMIMSIYERTKEIGVMKVIGANLRDIRKMFLLEAGMIGFLGGLAGVILSLLISLMMNTVLRDIIDMALWSIGGGGGSKISVIPWWMILAALVFSTAIGVIAGYSPAKRAMNLSALESLRNE